MRRSVGAVLLVLVCGWGCDEEGSSRACGSSETCRVDELCTGGVCGPVDVTDGDGDGLPDAIEVMAGTDPARADSDDDGVLDGDEVRWTPGSRLWDAPDADGDGVIDALESRVADADGDGVVDERDPCDADPGCPRALACMSEEGQPCVVGVGACEADGVTVCAMDGVSVECMGEPGVGAAEACNGVDDDCDGSVDEVWDALGTGCAVGVGACRVEGVVVCGGDGGDTMCDAVPGAGGDEVCNEVDDDCDGAVDEDFAELGLVCEAGVGACMAAGVMVCGRGGEVVCGAEPGLGSVEACNRVDDDCDGRVDEAFAEIGQVCAVGVGACEGLGVQRCADDGSGTVCDAVELEGGDEVCNGVDDDCDGSIDEGFAELGEPCEAGVGVCRRSGVTICAADGIGYACDAVLGEGGDEVCNTVDDDCDGSVDEGVGVGDPCVEGLGVCAADGVVACDPVLGSVCDATPGFGRPERCNTLDDDCDGMVDEAFADLGEGCMEGEGACLAVGTRVCAPGGAATMCDAVAGAGAVERCNGVDDDCDGSADEGFAVGEACQVGVGVCAVPSSWVCEGGEAVCPGEPGPAGVEAACDGRDEDCDGAVDEPWVAEGLGRVCTVGAGACAAEGVGVCGGDGVVCDAVEGQPSDEVCNRRDDDCDGSADEDFVTLGLVCEVGLGVCRGTGRWVCGGDGVVCDAVEGAPRDERCDGRDDDCDGRVDEDFPTVGEACAPGVGACRAEGEVVCRGGDAVCSVSAGAPRAELCDEVDDDCDGRVDEDFGPGCGRLAEAVSAGGYHTCALRPDGSIVCWGAVDAPPAGVYSGLAAGGDWHCALDAAGAPVCWGDGPAALFEPPAGPFVELALGAMHGCGRGADGVVVCWGVDQSGETAAPGVAFAAIAAAPALSCGVEAVGGALRCWGADDNGRASPPAGVFSAVALGTEHGCALDEVGAIACWGAAGLERLDAPAGAWVGLTVGGFHGCAVDADGAAVCWGAGSDDSGFPDFGQGAAPEGVEWVELSAGGYHTCGRTVAGEVVCFGAGAVDDVPDGLFHEGQSTVP